MSTSEEINPNPDEIKPAKAKSYRRRSRSRRPSFPADSRPAKTDIAENDRWLSPRRLRVRPGRRLNVRVALLSLVAIMVLGIAGYYWHRHQLAAQPGMYLAAADKAIAAEQYRAAQGYIEAYLHLRPSDPEGFFKLGDVLEKGNPSYSGLAAAVGAYQKVLELDPSREPVRAKLLDLQIEINPQAALVEAEAILGRKPKDIGAIRVRAKALDRLHMVSPTPPPILSVIKAYENLVNADKKDVEAALRLAILLRQNAAEYAQQYQSEEAAVVALADQSLNQLIRNNSNSAAAYLARHAYQTMHRTASSEARAISPDVQKAIELEPQNPEARLAAADCLAPTFAGSILVAGPLREKADPSAVALAQKQLDLLPEDFRAKDERYLLAQAMVDWYGGRVDDALATLDRGAKRSKSPVNLFQMRKAELLFATGRLEECEATLNHLAQALESSSSANPAPGNPGQWEAAYRALRASCLLAPDNPRRSPTAAAAELKVAQKVANSRGLSAVTLAELGRCYSLLKQDDLALAAFQNAAARMPGELGIRLGLADALRRTGRAQAAADEYRQVLQAVGNRKVPFEVEPIHRALVEALLEQQLHLPDSKRDWTAYSSAKAALEAAYPKSPAALLIEVDRQLALGGPGPRQRAMQLLQEGKRKFAESGEFWRRAAEIELRTGDAAGTMAAIAAGEKITGRKWSDLRAAVAAARGRKQEATSLLTASDEAARSADWLSRQEAALALAGGNVAEARRQLEILAAERPQDVVPILQLAEIALARSDAEELKRLEDRLDAIDQGGDLTRYLRIVRLIIRSRQGDKKALAEARQLTMSLKKDRPQWSLAHLSSGLVAEAEQNSDLAIDEYKAAFDLGDARPMLVRRLLSLLLRHRSDQAVQLLSSLPDELLVEPTMFPVSMVACLSRKETDRALALANKGVETRPSDPATRRFRGAILTARGSLAEAERDFSESALLAPADPRGWIALLWFHASNQHAERSIRVLAASRNLLEIFSASPEHGLTRARQADVIANCLLLKGDHAGAEQVLRAAGGAPPDSRTGTPEPVSDEEWSRRLDQLPLDIARVLKILSDSVPGSAAAPPVPPLDDELAAVVLLNRGGPSNQSLAATLLEKVPQEKRTRGQHLALARLYRLQGKKNRARTAYQWLLGAKSPRELQLEAAYFSIEDGFLADAESILKGFDKSDNATVTPWIRLRLAQRKPKEAAAIARGAIEKVSAGDATAMQILQAGLDWVLPTNDPELATLVSNRLAKIADSNPAARCFYADWLGRLPNRKSEAIAQCLEAFRADPSDQPYWSLGSILVSGPASADEEPRVERVLKEPASDPTRADPRILTAVGWVREMQSRFPEAIAAISAALARRPHDPILLNNYAWLRFAYDHQSAEARTRIDQAIQLAGPIPPLLDTKAVLLASGPELPNAIAIFEGLVLTGAEMTATMYLHLAQAYRALGQVDASRRALERANQIGLTRLSPKDAELARSMQAAPSPAGSSPAAKP